jgi:hypothetical protein
MTDRARHISVTVHLTVRSTTTVLNPFQPVERRTCGLMPDGGKTAPRPSAHQHHNRLCYPTGKSRMGSV